MNSPNELQILNTLPEFKNLREELTLVSEKKLRKVYVQKNDYIAIIGYKRLKDFARFTSHEDLSNDKIDYVGKTRIYLTGLKRRGVYRRASEAILRQYNENYNCATPDHQCMDCYNCFTYGGVIAVKGETEAIKSRLKAITAFSIQSDDEALIDEEEFHNIVHTDFRMEQAEQGQQKKPSIYNLLLIKPGVVFPFIDIIFNPSKFDLAMYLEMLRRADAMGYGSRSSLLGTMETKIIAVTDNLTISHKDLLTKIVLNEAGDISYEGLTQQFAQGEIVTDNQLEAIRKRLPELIDAYKTEIYGSAISNPTTKS
ncbi:MAG: type I-D CRISPR-associated protein Cas7/Csc2 [Candidatus Bathyarchaeota archaeon]|nr:type I-D CRISPR-associated protein Cas7/Csc2 [Candidatus Bathyarchaeota archaeon]